MNPNYSPTAAAAAERAMQEVTRQTTEQMDKARLAALPAKVRQDEMNRVLDALESHPFRKALISQHLEVKEISPPVNGRVIVTLGSLSGDNAVQLDLLVSDAAPYEDKNLVFEFMLAPRRLKDDTVQVANSGHGPDLDTSEGILSAATEIEAAVSVAMPEKEHVTQAVGIGDQVCRENADGSFTFLPPPCGVVLRGPSGEIKVIGSEDPNEQDDPEHPGEDEQERDRGGVE